MGHGWMDGWMRLVDGSLMSCRRNMGGTWMDVDGVVYDCVGVCVCVCVCAFRWATLGGRDDRQACLQLGATGALKL